MIATSDLKDEVSFYLAFVALFLVALLLLLALLDVLLGVHWFLVVLPAAFVVWLLATLLFVAAGAARTARGGGRAAV